MSIKYGLIKTTIEETDAAHLISFIDDSTNKDQKVSLTFKHCADYYVASDKLNDGAGYPLAHNLQSITKKKYTYSLQVFDGKTKELINPSNLNYEVLYINKSLRYTTNKGTWSFNVVFDSIPKEEIRLTIRIKGQNYLTTYAQITSNNKTLEHVHNIGIVNINNVPDGVSVVNTTLQQDNNGTVQEYVLNFPSSPTKYESSKITIPQGTKFYDANHDLLQGPISVKIGHFSPTTASSLFAPGWSVSNIEYNGQVFNNLGFISGGFYSVDIFDDSGRIAKTIY